MSKSDDGGASEASDTPFSFSLRIKRRIALM